MSQAAAALLLLSLTLGCSGSDADKPKSFVWTSAAPCPVPRFEAMGVVLDGELWVMGGFLSTELNVTRRIDVYDPRTDSWRLGDAQLPGAETHAGVANVDNDFVLVGGFVGNVLNRITTGNVWRWSTATASWSAGPELPAPLAGVAMALVGSELHVAGGLAQDGNTDSSEHLVLNFAGSGSWTSAPPLAVPRNHGGGAASGGLFFAIAGRHGWDEVAGDEPLLDAFDPAQSRWQARAPMPLGRSEIGAATVVLADGRLLVVGGSVPGLLPSDDVLAYDPQLDSWSELPPLPLSLKGVVAARIDDKIVVTTGSPTSIDPSGVTYIGCCL